MITSDTTAAAPTERTSSEPDPDALATAVQSCPAVARLSGGMAGEVATYLPGRRVTGVRIRPDEVQINVVGRYEHTVVEMADQVRTAVRPLVGDRPISIEIDDITVPGEPDDSEDGRATTG